MEACKKSKPKHQFGLASDILWDHIGKQSENYCLNMENISDTLACSLKKSQKYLCEEWKQQLARDVQSHWVKCTGK